MKLISGIGGFWGVGRRVGASAAAALWAVAASFPSMIGRVRRWIRRDASHEEAAMEALGRPLLRRERRRYRPRVSDLVEPAGFSDSGVLEHDDTDSGERSAYEYEQDPGEELTPSQELDSLEAERFALFLSRYPDVLGSLIQRERSRGNPLFM